jgi:hypothetical protein
MNKYKTTLLITLVALVMPLVTFSQLPGDFGGNPDPNPTDAPIDSNLWILLAAGLIFVGYKFYKYKKKVVSA